MLTEITISLKIGKYSNFSYHCELTQYINYSYQRMIVAIGARQNMMGKTQYSNVSHIPIVNIFLYK